MCVCRVCMYVCVCVCVLAKTKSSHSLLRRFVKLLHIVANKRRAEHGLDHRPLLGLLVQHGQHHHIQFFTVNVGNAVHLKKER